MRLPIKQLKKVLTSLLKKFLLKEDRNKLTDLNFVSIKQLVIYYQVSNILDQESRSNL